jgi:hypothetical protein
MKLEFTAEQIKNAPAICDAAARFVAAQISQAGLQAAQQGAVNLTEIAAFAAIFQAAIQAEQEPKNA